MAKDRCRLTRSTGRTEHKPVAGKADTRPIIGLTSGRFLSIGKIIPKSTVPAAPALFSARQDYIPSQSGFRLFASESWALERTLLISHFGSDKLFYVPSIGDRDEMGFWFRRPTNDIASKDVLPGIAPSAYVRRLRSVHHCTFNGDYGSIRRRRNLWRNPRHSLRGRLVLQSAGRSVLLRFPGRMYADARGVSAHMEVRV